MATTIIIGTDGSDLAVRAATAGLDLLRPADHVIVVTVVDAVDFMLAHDASGFAGPVVSQGELERDRDGLLAAGEAVLERATAALPVDAVETRVLEGKPGAELCKLASEVSATAVVVGSTGRGGIKRALLGSVSDYVVRNAPCAVVVVRDAGEG